MLDCTVQPSSEHQNSYPESTAKMTFFHALIVENAAGFVLAMVVTGQFMPIVRKEGLCVTR